MIVNRTHTISWGFIYSCGNCYQTSCDQKYTVIIKEVEITVPKLVELSITSTHFIFLADVSSMRTFPS